MKKCDAEIALAMSPQLDGHHPNFSNVFHFQELLGMEKLSFVCLGGGFISEATFLMFGRDFT